MCGTTLCESSLLPAFIHIPFLFVGESIVLKFAGRTAATKSLVLISLKYQADSAEAAELTVNCEKMVIGGLLLKDIGQSISQ